MSRGIYLQMSRLDDRRYLFKFNYWGAIDSVIFKEFVDNASGQDPQFLPVFHATNIEILEAILNLKSLAVTPCSVYGDDRLYLFYGRPAYRVYPPEEAGKKDRIVTPATPFQPVCFIFDSAVLSAANAMYPFDTGGFVNGYYKDLPHLSGDKSDRINNCKTHYELTNGVNTPKKFVSTFFENNSNYFRMKPRNTLLSSPPTLAVDKFHQMILRQAIPEVDERCGTMEIQLVSNITIDEHTVKVLVLPESYIDKPVIMDKVNALNLQFISYHDNIGRPEYHNGAMFQAVATYLMNEGLI